MSGTYLKVVVEYSFISKQRNKIYIDKFYSGLKSSEDSRKFVPFLFLVLVSSGPRMLKMAQGREEKAEWTLVYIF